MPTARAERFAVTVAAAPPWFTVTASGRTRLSGTAALSSNSVSGEQRVLLDVSLETTGIRVREAVPGTRFPARCFERHVEEGGWFCLGLSSGWMVEDAETAVHWWSALHDFLRLQRVASRTGLWPDRSALSHGDAGRHHRDALALAAATGLLEAYERHVGGDTTIVSALLAKLRADGLRLINGRTPCPCGQSLRGERVLRRNCPRRNEVLALLREERLRAEKLKRFWNAVEGMPCCGTMRGCPLSAGAVPGSAMAA